MRKKQKAKNNKTHTHSLGTEQLQLSLGFSPCPNDCFIFDAMLHGKIDTEGLLFKPVIEDVEALNQKAFKSKLDITKLSFFAFSQVQKDYTLLDSGSALGFGVGQSFWLMAAVLFSYSFFQNAILAQFEAVTMYHLQSSRADYGKIRLWGSLGFIATVAGLGVLFDWVAISWLPLTLLLCAFAASATPPNKQITIIITSVVFPVAGKPIIALYGLPSVIAFSNTAMLGSAIGVAGSFGVLGGGLFSSVFVLLSGLLFVPVPSSSLLFEPSKIVGVGSSKLFGNITGKLYSSVEDVDCSKLLFSSVVLVFLDGLDELSDDMMWPFYEFITRC